MRPSYFAAMSAAFLEPMTLMAYLNREAGRELHQEIDGVEPVGMIGGHLGHQRRRRFQPARVRENSALHSKLAPDPLHTIAWQQGQPRVDGRPPPR
jgi:hypothetical protein